VIGPRARREVRCELVGDSLQLVVDSIPVVWGRAAHHVSIHITTGSQCRELNLIDPMDRSLQILLGDAMQLERLAAGDLQGAVAQLIAHVKVSQQLGHREPSAGNARPDHHLIGLASALIARGSPCIAIILLIGTVKFQELNRVLVKMIGVGSQLFG